MAHKSGKKTIKRQLAPVFWDINRKEGRFIPKTHPGTHSIDTSYPLGVLIRDLLNITNNMYEAKKIINEGKVKIDNVKRYNPNFPAGLMDTIELVPSKQTFRLVPKGSRLLHPIVIDEAEKSVKIVKVKKKVLIAGKRVQYGFHDGKTKITDKHLQVGDTCLVNLPQLDIIKHVPLEINSLVLIIRGDNVGKMGRIQEIKEGTYSLPKRVVISMESRILEIPISMIMVVGNEDIPIIKVN